MTIAVGASFVPGVIARRSARRVRRAACWAPVAGAGLVLAVRGGRRGRGPVVPIRADDRGSGRRSGCGRASASSIPWKVIRVSLGHAPGDWAPAAFLPVAALLGLALAGGERRGQAARAAVTGAVALVLAWLSVAGYLPTWASNAPVYAALAAVCMAFLVGDGLTSALGGMERASFGFRQIGTVLLSGVLVLGLSLQAMAAMVGDLVDRRRREGAGRLVGARRVARRAPTTSCGSARCDGQPFPAPGGDPTGVVEQGARDRDLRPHRPAGHAGDRHRTSAHRRRRPGAARRAARCAVGHDRARRRAPGAVRRAVRDRRRRRRARGGA